MPDYLIIKPSSLGDIIHALIVVNALKAQQPQARITWVVRQNFAPIITSTGLADEIIAFDRKGGAKGFFDLLKRVRKKRYDAVLDMQGLLRTGIMMLAARSPKKLARSDAREGAQLFANAWAPIPQCSIHAVDILMEFLPLLGLQKIYVPLQLKASSKAPALASGTVLVFPSARGKWAQKEWPYFKELTEKLLIKKIPAAWCSDLPLNVPAGAQNFCGKVPLGELLPFIAQARLVISNDSGPVHMAAALGVPVIGLYGPTDAKKVGPYPSSASQNITISANSENITDISVDEVFAAAQKLIS